jgi:Ca-activated chloride channel homolog
MRSERFIISKTRRTLLPTLFVALLTANASAGTVLAASVSHEAQQMLPYINAGPDSQFAQIDFAQLYMDTGNHELLKNEEQVQQRKHLVEIGAISALDLDAPNKALEEYNRAASLMKEQKAQEAIIHLHKAIAVYPKFVLAHNTLGLAYIELGDSHAREEFEEAARLDPKFPGSFVHLGMLALSANDFATADSSLEKAATLSPKDPKTLAALAFAQNGDHKYAQVLQTVDRVHTLEHRNFANVHYIAAAAGMALENYDVVERQLKLFIAEAPTDPLAPVARKNLNALERRKMASPSAATVQARHTFPNSDRLKTQLNAVGTETDSENCETCKDADEFVEPPEAYGAGASPNATSTAYARAGALFTIQKVIDETALFFAVSSHGHMVSDLQLSDINIRDNKKPPAKIFEFLPQSKLPLRLALLIDTSGSVQDRFAFEKRAAGRFVEKVLNGTSDLGFVAGFSGETTVTRDFTANATELRAGIDQLKSGGGTSLFDAVTFSCGKLAEYPEAGRAALVLVVISDGEDNSSHRSLKQTIEHAESSGVTIYSVSTSESARAQTDADRVLQLLAERSGGEAMFPGDLTTFEKSLDKLRELIRNRYLLAYKPSDFVPDGKYRAVRVVAQRDGKHMQVYVRKGYYARVAAHHQ